MSLVTIADSGKVAEPIESLHYYKWLEGKAPTDIHSTATKREYLQEAYGFVIGTDVITEADLDLLKIIEQHYFYVKLAPALKERLNDYTRAQNELQNKED